MEEKKEVSLFREKSLEAVQSPESLNDYLRVTSPGVWLVLGTVIALLAGAVIWSIFGRITTTIDVAVVANIEKCVCIVPYNEMQKVMARGFVSLNGQDYALKADEKLDVVVISDQTSNYVRSVGGFSNGDVTVEVPMEAQLDAGVYTGKVLTESLQPISLLLQ